MIIPSMKRSSSSVVSDLEEELKSLRASKKLAYARWHSANASNFKTENAQRKMDELHEVKEAYDECLRKLEHAKMASKSGVAATNVPGTTLQSAFKEVVAATVPPAAAASGAASAPKEAVAVTVPPATASGSSKSNPSVLHVLLQKVKGIEQQAMSTTATPSCSLSTTVPLANQMLVKALNENKALVASRNSLMSEIKDLMGISLRK